MTIVFYDGDCGLCQRSIAYLSRVDQDAKNLQFAPLNGETYKKIYGDIPSKLTSVKVYSQNKSFEKSAAFFELCSILGGAHRLFLVFRVIPRFILDALYDLIASHRKKVSCILVTKDDRFLN